MFAQIRRNIEILDTGDRIQVEHAEAMKWLRHNRQKFDLVFLDPPFALGLVENSLMLLQEQGCLQPHVMIYVESGPGLQLPDWLRVVRQGKAGKVKFMLVELL